MDRKWTKIEWQIILPVVVVLLAVAAFVALLTLLNDIRADWALVIVLMLAGIASFAVWQPSKLAQQNHSLKAELAQRTSELSTQRTRLTALHDMAQCLGSPLRMEEVLMQGAERVKTVLDVDAAHIHLVGNEGQNLKLETAVGTPVSFLAEEATIGVGECLCGLVASSVQPVVVTDLRSDARATRVACKRHGYCSIASVPLRSHDRALGILTVNSRARREFTPADLEMLTTLGNQLGAAIENAQFYADMERRVQELSRQVEHLVVVQERERISREIHDGLAQALALLNMRVSVTQSLLVAGQTEQARKELAEAAEVIDVANRDVREAITALRLTSPKGAAFTPTLKEFVLDFGLRNNIETDFQAVDGARAIVLAPITEVQLMRIIQESLTNVRKHARAQHANVALTRRGARLLVSIEDDGQGFDMDAVLTGQNKKNFGLTTMSERAASIGGMLDVQTHIGGGTRITVSVPCEQQPAPERQAPLEEITD
jgi:two-component system nitrate/nitrite sensor histidine kinase NarX